jgi:hypothetical protein
MYQHRSSLSNRRIGNLPPMTGIFPNYQEVTVIGTPNYEQCTVQHVNAPSGNMKSVDEHFVERVRRTKCCRRNFE